MLMAVHGQWNIRRIFALAVVQVRGSARAGCAGCGRGAAAAESDVYMVYCHRRRRVAAALWPVLWVVRGSKAVISVLSK